MIKCIDSVPKLAPTVAGHPPVVLAPKTLKSILRQAGLSR